MRIPERIIREMHALSLAGMPDKLIGKKFGYATICVEHALARVISDGRITKNMYGGANNPDRVNHLNGVDRRILYV